MVMAANTVITIGRQYGSGGREIGMKLAQDLGIKCYDKELLDRAAKDSGICQELFEHHDEKPTSSFFIPWLWILILLVILPQPLQICPLITKFFWHSLTPLRNWHKRSPVLW